MKLIESQKNYITFNYGFKYYNIHSTWKNTFQYTII